MSNSTCTWEGCERPAVSRGYCTRCYQRARRQGLITDVQQHVRQGAECSVEGCQEKPQGRGLCRSHYARQWRHGDPTVIKKVRRGPGCSVEGCEGRHQGHGYCNEHYLRWKRHGDPLAGGPTRMNNEGTPCAGPDCERAAVSKGLCGTHDMQQRTAGVLTPIRQYKPKGVPCSVDGCEKPALSEGLCQTHYRRRNRGEGNWDSPIVPRAAHGEGHVNDDGYRVITVDGRPKLEHRHLIEQLLGRRLRRTETVHHVNGDRADNRTKGPLRPVNGKLRSGNLELWETSQPAGQEVPAKVKYAREILALYGDLVPEQ